MKAVMVMFDSLNRKMLKPYGCAFTKTPNFQRLAERSAIFDNCYAGSLPCIPARRELHTGRYNFLHRSWGPLEPFDDSMPELLWKNGIHTHLVSDHYHYWQDGGATYHSRYQTWEAFRGQEGDPWKGMVGRLPDHRSNLVNFTGMRKGLYEQDVVNRSYIRSEDDFPQARTFEAGLEFIRTNHRADRWFLQIEAFDPHEPFFSARRYQNLYPHNYEGPPFDWPDYAKVAETPEQVKHCRLEYAALLSMCDHSLGRVLDLFDEYDLWKDTMLIVNTDHGYLLGEHGLWAKNYMPPYDEIAHTPLFIWDPRSGISGKRRSSLVQTVDLPVTLLNYFSVPVPPDMQGKDLHPVIRSDEKVREAALFGIHGGHICCTDGRYVYMKAPRTEENQPLYEYTLMPAHMSFMFLPAELKTMEKAKPFRFTKGCPVMRFNAFSQNGLSAYGDLLFDLQNDPEQAHAFRSDAITDDMEEKMVALMKMNDTPEEQFDRTGLVL